MPAQEPKSFQDHFGAIAEAYATFRPRYPQALYSFLAAQSPDRHLAWDCACGSGQVAVPLSRYFDRVVATDASEDQITQAEAVNGVEYKLARAEAAPLEDRSVSLITVAQALHWFDFSAFYAEAQRVLTDAGVIAVWCYTLCRSEPEINAILDHYYGEILDEYWPPERSYVEAGYSNIPFPFRRIPSPEYSMETRWQLDQLIGYISSWSASNRLVQAQGADAFLEVKTALTHSWGDKEEQKKFCWPVHLLLGRQ